jgi:hypothetical protein
MGTVRPQVNGINALKLEIGWLRTIYEHTRPKWDTARNFATRLCVNERKLRAERRIRVTMEAHYLSRTVAISSRVFNQ